MKKPGPTYNESAPLPDTAVVDLPGWGVNNGSATPHSVKDRTVLALAMQASRMGAWEMDAARNEIWLSPELGAILGIETEVQRRPVEYFYQLVHEEDKDRAAAEIGKSIDEERHFQFELRFSHSDGTLRWMEVRGQAIGFESGGRGRIYGVSIDVTERKAAEGRALFLADLSRAVQKLSDPSEVLRVTAERLGRFLGADRCAYAEVEDESVFSITGDYTCGVSSIVGTWEVASFGEACERQMRANEPYVVDDTESDPRIGPEHLTAYRATEIGAVICVPLHKNGRFTAAMAVHQRSPRIWTEPEIDLVREVVNRCWESLERVRAARIVRESDERFRLALASGAVTVYEQDENLNYKWVYPPERYRPDVVGKSDEELSPGEDSRLRTEIKRKVLRTGEPVRTETSATVFGQVYWFDMFIEPRRDADGKIIGVGGTALDITERRRAEEEVKASAERLNLALAAAGLGDWSWDAGTDVVTLSAKAAEIFGLPPGPSISWSAMQEMLHRDDREAAADAVRTAVAEGTRYDVEYRVTRPDGERVVVAAFGRAVYGADGECTGMFGVVQDITARRRLQQELAQSEARFRALVEQAPFSVQLFRPDGRHIGVNRAWEELWGTSMDAIPDYNILEDPQLEARGIADDIRRVFAGEVVEIPAIRYDPNETIPGVSSNNDPVRWVSAIAFPLKDADGNIREVALIHHDVTQRKIAEGMLQRYRILSENARDVIWLLRPDGRLVEVNQAAVDIYGYSRDELLSMNLRELRADSSLPTLAEQLRTASEDGVKFETVHKRRDGTEFPVEVTANGAEFNGERFVLGIVRDVSERKLAEQRLRENEQNLRTLADTIPQLAWMAEADGRISWYNKGWYDYTGTAHKEVEGDGWHRVHDPEMLPAVLERWQRSLETGEPFEMEFPLRAADGSYSWFLTRVNPLRDPSGRILRWFGTNTDITRIREIEEGLRQARNELEERVAARTRDLAEANRLLIKQIEERDAAEAERIRLLKKLFTIQEDERGRIARDIHDQLGQRITALRLRTASLKDLCAEGDPVRQRLDGLQEIAEQLDHEVGFVSWQLRPSILDDLKFSDALKNYVAEWSRHSEIPAEFHSTGLADISVDHDVEMNLYRILQEALNNVGKHSRAERVNVLLELRGDELSMIIEDDGVGIASVESAEEQGNHGFGLIGMRERASLVGGSIQIESGENGGTEIFVRVPLTPTAIRESNPQ